MLGAMLSGALLPLKLAWASVAQAAALAAASAKSFGGAAFGAARVTRQLASAGKQASSQVSAPLALSGNSLPVF